MSSYLLCWIFILITGVTTIIGTIEPLYSIGFLSVTFGGASMVFALYTLLLKPSKRVNLKRIVNRGNNGIQDN